MLQVTSYHESYRDGVVQSLSITVKPRTLSIRVLFNVDRMSDPPVALFDELLQATGDGHFKRITSDKANEIIEAIEIAVEKAESEGYEVRTAVDAIEERA